DSDVPHRGDLDADVNGLVHHRFGVIGVIGDIVVGRWRYDHDEHSVRRRVGRLDDRDRRRPDDDLVHSAGGRSNARRDRSDRDAERLPVGRDRHRVEYTERQR
ncbi:MAG TPA: hypothetical protein VIJ60_08370, partial [Acidimicrobiales bacterium]